MELFITLPMLSRSLSPKVVAWVMMKFVWLLTPPSATVLFCLRFLPLSPIIFLLAIFSLHLASSLTLFSVESWYLWWDIISVGEASSMTVFISIRVPLSCSLSLVAAVCRWSLIISIVLFSACLMCSLKMCWTGESSCLAVMHLSFILSPVCDRLFFHIQR